MRSVEARFNSSLVRSILLTLGLCASSALAQSTIFYETMGTVGGTVQLTAHEAANGFDNDALTMTGGGAVSNSDIRATSVSAGYTNSAGSAASGAANTFFSANFERGFAVEGINAAGYNDLTLEFGYRKEATTSNATFNVQWSTNAGTIWTGLTLTNYPAENAAVGWYLISAGLPPEAAASGLSIRWLRAATPNGNSIRVDDILLRGSSATAPEVIVTTPNATVPFETNAVDVAGTANANTVGQLTWTNSLTGSSGTIAAALNWTVPSVGLNVGTNLITVSGTNNSGSASSDNVSIIRLAAIVTNVQFTAASATVPEASAVVTVTVYKTTADGNVSGEVGLSGSAAETSDFTINTTNFTLSGATTSATFEVTVVDDGDLESAETVILTITNVTGGTLGTPSAYTLTISANDAPAPPNAPVWINEMNYDDPGADSNEFIEVAGPAGTDLSVYSLILYNGGNGLLYASNALSGTLTNDGCGYSTVVQSYAPNGFQNGPDAVAIVSNGTTVIQFLSYGGSFTALDGPALGLTSVNIGSDPGAGSLQLTGTGNAYSEFTWVTNSTFSQNALNAGQTIDPCGGGNPELDAWKTLYWGSVGAYTGDSADDDADGSLNIEEFIAGTIPVVAGGGATNFFRVANIVNSNGSQIVINPSVTGRLYSVYGTTNLVDGNSWSPVTTDVLGTGSSLNLTGGTANAQSFRVIVEMENP